MNNMLISLSELFTCEGKEKTYTPDIQMTHFQTPDDGGAYEIVERDSLKLHVRNIGERSLHMQGKICLTLSIPCARCLEPVIVPFDLEVDHELNLNQSEEERVSDLDEQPYLQGYNLDVDQLVCNELLLSLPMKVLCRENCKGICNRCGTNLNHKICDCDTWAPSLGMSAIQDIFKQSKEV